MRQLIANGSVSYAYIGIVTTDLTPAFARRFRYSVKHGAVVTRIEQSSPAHTAGLRAGTSELQYLGADFPARADVIVAIDGQPVRTSEDLVRIVTERLSPGELARFTVVRGASRLNIGVRLANRPANP
jgi:2-alkenal reductase